jgi:hypothetical protein
MILGGKLVAALMGSKEVSDAFYKKYEGKSGIISGQKKAPHLMLLTVTSALGRSSLYNRLKLRDECGNLLIDLHRIGETRGYGHFQLSNELFERIRHLLIVEDHPYANGHEFGEGPNWRFRVLRVGLRRLGLNEELIRHGIHREVFAMAMTPDFSQFLCGGVKVNESERPLASTIANAALHRWVIPRSESDHGYLEFHREQIIDKIFSSDVDTTPLSNSPVPSDDKQVTYFQIAAPKMSVVT